MRQHYIPVSFLKRWANEKGAIVRYGMIRNRLIADKKMPDEVCYIENGWTLGPEIKPEHRAYVEKQITDKVDTKAIETFRVIDANGISNLSVEDAFNVMAFCSSLIARSPILVGMTDSTASDSLKKLLVEEFAKAPADDPLKTHFKDPIDATYRYFPGLIENVGKLLIPKIALDSRFIENLGARQWCLFDFSRTSVGTIPLPDTGLIAIGSGFETPDSIVALPIDRQKVLYFASAETLDRLIGVGAGRLAIATVESAVIKARTFVFGDMNVNSNILERQFRAKGS
jgi:hypothetical protein